MMALPARVEIPNFFRLPGFTEIPASADEVKSRYGNLAKTKHPDLGRNSEHFQALMAAADQATAWFAAGGKSA